MKRILIIEDDETIAAIERDYLVRSDFAVDIAATGGEGLALGRTGKYDLILLDLMLPGMDGFSVCHALRKALDIPILMVTARQEDIDKIRGLGMGADDYITKPFSPSVLVARIKANLAQYDRLKGRAGRAQIQMGDIVFSKEALYERIWGYDALGDNATVAVHINRLREKIEKTPSEPRHIQTVWGAGYRFRP
mgnify:CR=1 FL=1